MLRNYIIVAFRYITRNKLESVINNLGLGLGIGVFIIISVFITQELQYDKFINDSGRIFRVEIGDWALMAPGVANVAKNICPEVEEALSVEQFTFNNELVRVGESLMRINDYYPVSQSFFDIFSINIIQGDNENPLAEPYSLVLTENEANRLFGKHNPIGKNLTVFSKYEFTVTAVMENPTLFHLPVNGIMPIDFTYELYNDKSREEQFLGNQNNPTYLKLINSSDKDKVENRLSKYANEIASGQQTISVNLRPIGDIYFKGALPFEGNVKHGNIQFMRVMFFVAFLILLLAATNYINLSTAHAAARAKEIGIRKVNGGTRTSIAAQFIGESVITTLFALVVGGVVAELFSPVFGNLIEKDLNMMFFSDPVMILYCIAGAILLGVLSGIYPALYISAFSPSRVLKGEITKGSNRGYFRKTLIVFQFAVSTGLIISTLIIYSQLDYFIKTDVGFDKEQIINIDIPRRTAYSYSTFRENLLKTPGVISVSQSNSKPGRIQWQEGWHDEHGESHSFSYIPADPDYIEVVGLKLIQGRNLDWDRASDVGGAYIINETFAQQLGYENPIDQKIPGYGDRTIVGVVEDFHFNSLHSAIGPLGISFRNMHYNTYNIKIDISNTANVINRIKALWGNYAVDAPFEYTFLNESYDDLYNGEQRMGNLYGFFAIIAIFIACMGLFGLSAHMLQARVKEMGVRKVLGASMVRIVGIMGKEFVILVLIANAFAWPISFYAMGLWLQGFPFATSINPLFFLVALIASLLIAILTVSYHSWKTARANPVDALKYE